MPKVQLGDEAYRIVGDNGEEGELAAYGEAATLEVGLTRYVAVVDADPDDDHNVMSLLPEGEWMIEGRGVPGVDVEDVEFAEASAAAGVEIEEGEEDEEDEDEGEEEDESGEEEEEDGEDTEDDEEDEDKTEELRGLVPAFA